MIIAIVAGLAIGFAFGHIHGEAWMQRGCSVSCRNYIRR